MLCLAPRPSCINRCRNERTHSYHLSSQIPARSQIIFNGHFPCHAGHILQITCAWGFMIKADSDACGLALPVLFKGLLRGVPVSLLKVQRGSLLPALQIRATIKRAEQELPGGPEVETPCFRCRGQISSPGQGNKIPYNTLCGNARSPPPPANFFNCKLFS